MAITETIIQAANNLKNNGRLATDEPQTHLLIPLKGSSLPLGVAAGVIRRNIIEHPDDKTRPGEEHTIPPEE